MNAFLAIAGTVILLDIIWLTFKNKYHQSLFKSIQHSALTPRMIPAIAIYLLLPLAIYLGAVQPSHSVFHGITRGAIVGALLYAFYDLTNYATFTNWTLQMTLTDIAWGTVLCAVAAGVGYSFQNLKK
jgi:uncharacterized membrane protein